MSSSRPEWNAAWVRLDETGSVIFSQDLDLSAAPKHLYVRFSADPGFVFLVNDHVMAHGPQPGDEMHWFYDQVDLGPFLRSGKNRLEFHLVQDIVVGSASHRRSVTAAWVFECAEPGFESLCTPGTWTRHIARVDETTEDELLDASEEDEWDGEPALELGARQQGSWALVPRSVPASGVSRSPMVFSASGSDALDVSLPETMLALVRLHLKPTSGATSSVVVESSPSESLNPEISRSVLYYFTPACHQSWPCGEPEAIRRLEVLTMSSDAPCVESVMVYPVEPQVRAESSFRASDERVAPIWQASVKTLQLSAYDGYWDTPVTKRQDAFDSRIQALCGYYLSPDRSLQRNAIKMLSRSAVPEGFTCAAWPSETRLIQPAKSLWWILMLYDQLLYDRVPQDIFDDELAQTIVRRWRMLTRGDLSRTFDCFADDVPEWEHGVPPGGPLSTVHLLTKLCARIAVADLLVQQPFASGSFHADELIQDVMEGAESLHGLVSHRRDLTQTPSEHAEAMFRVCQQMAGLEPDPWLESALDEHPQIARCSPAFSYYKHLSMDCQDYLGELGPWHEMIEAGMSTFGDGVDAATGPIRGAMGHPVLGFFQVVAGVTSASAGWSVARIEPRPGPLRSFEARIAHPDGMLLVHFEDGALKIDSPVPFELIWRGSRASFASGAHSVPA